jgi:hypothetical protein
MLRFLAVTLALALAAACMRDQWGESTRQELVGRAQRSRAIWDTTLASLRFDPGRPDPVYARQFELDSSNAEWLRSALTERGWPFAAVAGTDAEAAAFHIVRNATHDTAFQAEVLRMLEPLAAAGQVSGQRFAELFDRFEVRAGRPQRYGTLFTIGADTVTIDPIADSAQVDARRARLGLPPLAEYLRTLESTIFP